jgi:hypothetical protein
MPGRAPPKILLLGALLAASCGAPSPAPPNPAAPALCAAAHLDTCERRLAQALAEGALALPRDLAAAYASARAERDPEDPWARLFRDLDRAPHPAAAILAEGSLPAPVSAAAAAATTRLGDAARALTLTPLPRPDAISPDDLLLALAGAAGYRHLVRIRPGPDGITQLFPNDPLAPFTAGLPAVLRDDEALALAHLADDLALAASIRAAFDAAGASRYVDAAHEADRLTALVQKRDLWTEPALRARYALQILGNAGLTLDPANDAQGEPPEAGDAPAPAAEGTPYGDLLRVRTSKDELREWEARRAKILAAIPADRREDVAALFSRSRAACADGRPPPMAGVRDLIFANKLAGALIRDKATEAHGARAGLLPLPEWLKRYEALVGLVARTRTAWALAPALLRERGEAFGLNPAGSTTYRRVTELGLAHLAALKELTASEKLRYRALSQLALAGSPGILSDAPLREAWLALTQATIRDKLATAKGASAVASSLFTGVLAGLSYPPAIQEAHYLALQGAFAAKLHGDLMQQTGWGAAGLYALDGAYRLMTGEGPKLGFSGDQIARALSDPALSYPTLAALATAAARYAALAAEHRLDPELTQIERFPPERRAARDALRSAIGGLGAPGEAPNNVLDDVTTLADGLIAALSVALGGPTSRRDEKGAPAKPAATCPSKAPVKLTPETRRALAKLGDVRQRILSHPRYKDGDSAWVRRTRLLVTLLSDAMDLARKEDKRLSFEIPAALAEKNVSEALRDWDDRGAAEAASSLYALGRSYVSADKPSSLVSVEAPHVRRVLRGLVDFFQSDSGGKATPGGAGVALLSAVAKLGPERGAGGDLAASLLSYASAFHKSKQPDQGDLCLLGSMVLSAVTQSPPSPQAIALADEHRSRIAWALHFLAEISRARRGEGPDTSAYAEGMRAAIDDACQAPNAETTLSVMQAIRDFKGGKRSPARAALDRVLEKADAEGLGVPRMAYRYEEKTRAKVFALTVEVSYGAGVLSSANTFQVGLGVRSPGAPEGSMTATLSPADGGKAGEDAARYYVHAAALAAVYHLLEGDTDRAVAAASRAIGALSMGVRLGARTLRAEKPASFGADARALLAVAAQLAADAGMPFLAGDLFTVLRQGFEDDTDDRAVASILAPDPPVLGLSGIPGIQAVIDRAERSLSILAEPLACTVKKIERGGYEEPGCDAYPLALSLRIADALKKLPRLKRGALSGARCSALRPLDGFLASADMGAYDPDAFTRAVEELRADGRLYDAAILLTRQRRDNHCSPAILSAARSLARSPILGPFVRSDLRSAAINCSIAGGGPELAADVMALDEETRRLPDPTRNLKVMLSLAELAARTDQWELLTTLSSQPDFVDRWMSVHPNAAAAALLVAHAVPAVHGSAADLEKTREAYDLLCETFPPGERASLCEQIRKLRAPSAASSTERQRLGKEAIKKLVEGVSGRGGG